MVSDKLTTNFSNGINMGVLHMIEKLNKLTNDYNSGKYGDKPVGIQLLPSFIEDVSDVILEEYSINREALASLITAVWFRPSVHSFAGDMDFFLEQYQSLVDSQG